MNSLEIHIDTEKDFSGYSSISIGFEVCSRMNIEALLSPITSRFIEEPVAPYWKDYDQIESEHPANLPQRFDTSNWGILVASIGGSRVGGAILACKSVDFEMLAGRDDLAVLVDLRIKAELRDQGIGRNTWLTRSEPSGIQAAAFKG